MAVETVGQVSHLVPKLSLPPWPVSIAGRFSCSSSPPPVLISTNRAHLNPHRLKELYAICNHSCSRFPNVDAAGRVEPVDLVKLCTAVSHSPVVVSAFTKPEYVKPGSASSVEGLKLSGIGGDWIRKMVRVTPENGQLIGFGRAVSDCGLAASIYDVMVHPALRGRGIGRMIIQRIVRILTGKGIYDISALCSENERPFFRACGFGYDSLESTTMMYTAVPVKLSEEDKVTSAGRKLLIFPQKTEIQT